MDFRLNAPRMKRSALEIACACRTPRILPVKSAYNSREDSHQKEHAETAKSVPAGLSDKELALTLAWPKQRTAAGAPALCSSSSTTKRDVRLLAHRASAAWASP